MTYRTIPIRKVKRNVARYNMKKEGLKHLNDKYYISDHKTSKFAQEWRNYCELKEN